MLNKKETIRQIRKHVRKHEYNIVIVAILIVFAMFLFSKFLTVGIPRDNTFPWDNNVNYKVEKPWKL